MTGQYDNTTERERRLHQILLAYLKAMEKGQRPDRQELLSSHAEFAAELAEFFVSHDQIDEWAAPLLLVGQSVSVATPKPEQTPSLGVEGDGSQAPAKTGTFGDYELLEEIGQGGMGVVYKARQRSLNRLVALKMIRAGGLACRADLQRFRTEAEAAASLDHPHIVPIYEVGELEGQPYFTMKLVSGRGLAEILPRFMSDPRATARLLVAVAQAVHHAHQRGILHRDLKPSNILLDGEGRPHVTDFGLAKRLEVDSSLTQSGLLVGTPSYMAPEQATAQRGAITTATDIHGLGAVLYVLLTGRPPFRGDSVLDTLEQVKQREPQPPSSSNRQVDRDLETICLKCLQKEPRERYGSALALAEDLEHWLAGEPIQARPISRRERVWRWCRRNPALAVLTAAVATLLVAVAIGATLAAFQFRRMAQDSEQALYFHRIALAHRELTAIHPNPRRAEELLDLCPPDRRGWEWDYLKRLWRVEPVVLRDPGNKGVSGVAFSPDGEHLAAACFDHTVKVWHLRTGEVVTLRGHEKYVYSLAFSPTNGTQIASASADKTVRIWDLTTRQEVRRLPGTESTDHGMAQSLTFSPDGRWLAAAGKDGTVRVWDAASGDVRRTLSDRGINATCVAFSPDGQLLASGNLYGIVRVWDAPTGRPLHTLSEHSHHVGALAFSPDGRRLAAGYFDRLIDVWDTRTGKRLDRLAGHTGLVLGLAFSPDGSRLASTSQDWSVRIWDLSTGQEVLQLRGHTDWCQGLAFHPDGRLLASASMDRTIRLWDATPLTGKEGRELLTFSKHPHEVRSLAISPDGTRIASAGLGPTLYVWDANTGQVTQTFSDFKQTVFSMAFSPDGRHLAAAGRDDVGPKPDVLKVWDVETGQPVLAHRESQAIYSISLSPDGQWLALGIQDGNVKIWDARTGQAMVLVGKHDGEVRGLTFRPDGQRLASASRDGTVKVWDVTRAWLPGHGLCTRAAQPVLTLTGDAGFWGVAYSPDGRRLLTVSVDGQLTLREAETGQPIGTVAGQFSGQSQGTSAAFSPDGRWVASAAEDCTVKVWDAETLACKHTFRGHMAPSPSLAFSPGGRRLVSASQDKTVKVWDLTRLDRKLE